MRGNDARRFVGAIAVTAAGFLSSGCGSSDPSSDGTAATSAPSQETTADAATLSTPPSTNPSTSLVGPTEPPSAPSEPPSPPGDFYAPPDPLTKADPGRLIWAERVDLALNPPADVWRILYHSRTEHGDDVAVSGFAVVPTAPSAGLRDVYAWAHATAGMGDQCAPSRAVRDNLPPFGGVQVERGTVLVATDYPGLGTPGIPTYAEGAAEAQAVLDSVRAVAELPGVGRLDDLLIAGHSQGGAVSLIASEIIARYAPELSLVGSIALAPGAVFPSFVDGILASPEKGLILIGASGLRAGHPDIDLAASLSPAAIADLAQVESECVGETVERYRHVPTEDIAPLLPGSVDEIAALLEGNAPGSSPIAVPVFLGQGAADLPPQVDVSGQLLELYCALGTDITLHAYADADHMGVIDAAAADILDFITARYEHAPSPSGCS